MAKKSLIQPLEYAEVNEKNTKETINLLKEVYFEDKEKLFDFILKYLKDDKVFSKILLEVSKRNSYYSETAILTYHLLNTLFPRVQVSEKNIEYARKKYKRIIKDQVPYSKKENIESLLKNESFVDYINENLKEEFDMCEELNFKIVKNKKELNEFFEKLENEEDYSFCITEESAMLLEFMLYKHFEIGKLVTEISIYDAFGYISEIESYKSKKTNHEIEGNILQKMLLEETVKFFDYSIKNSFLVFVSYENAIHDRENNILKKYLKNNKNDDK